MAESALLLRRELDASRKRQKLLVERLMESNEALKDAGQLLDLLKQQNDQLKADLAMLAKAPVPRAG